MSDVRINSIRLSNFKGCTDLKFDFNGENAVIIGDNGTGKSTIFDAFCWVLYGKDSHDRSNFDIKTIDRTTGEHIHKAEHCVEVVLSINGSAQTLKRVYLESWVKRRGEESTTFEGHETQYYFNGVRVDTKQAYGAIVDGIIPEATFKIITNPLYFNTCVDWKGRRTALLSMVGTVDESQLREQFSELIKQMGNDDLTTFKKRIAGEKRVNSESLKRIAPEIAGIRRVMPEAENYGSIEHQINMMWAAHNAEVTGIRKEIEAVDKQIADRGAADEAVGQRHNDRLRRQNQIRTQLSEFIEARRAEAKAKNIQRDNAIADAERKASKIADDIEALERSRATKETDGNAARDKRDQIEKEVDEMREAYRQKKAEAFTYAPTTQCHACGQELPADTIAEAERQARDNFDQERRAQLDAMLGKAELLKDTYTKLGTLVSKYDNEIAMADQRLSELGAEKATADKEVEAARAVPVLDLDAVEVAAKAHANYKALETDLASIQQELDLDVSNDNSDLTIQRKALEAKIEAVGKKFEEEAAPFKERLQRKETAEKCKREIELLEAEEKVLAVKIAELEKAEFAASAYTKASIEAIEDKVNSHFNLVRWRMYSQLVNGGEEECCEATVDGVPFASLNSAARVLAGIDIIASFCKFYGVSAPVFIDNSESIVKDFTLDSQIIRLQVVKGAALELKNK